MCTTDSPDVAVVFPAVNLFGIFWLSTSERYRVILDEHLYKSLKNPCVFSRLACILIAITRQIFDKNTLFSAIKVEKKH